MTETAEQHLECTIFLEVHGMGRCAGCGGSECAGKRSSVLNDEVHYI